MLDAHAAHLVVVGDTLLAREIAHDLGLLGALDVLVGDVVIGDESDLRRIEHLLDADLAELFDGNGGGDVVGQHEVEIAFDQLTRLHFVEPRMGGEDLLRHGAPLCGGSLAPALPRTDPGNRSQLYHSL